MSIKSFAAATFAVRATIINGVCPSAPTAFASAPASSSAFMIPAFELNAASLRGCRPQLIVDVRLRSRLQQTRDEIRIIEARSPQQWRGTVGLSQIHIRFFRQSSSAAVRCPDFIASAKGASAAKAVTVASVTMRSPFIDYTSTSFSNT